jgi:hypothetical protein
MGNADKFIGYLESVRDVNPEITDEIIRVTGAIFEAVASKKAKKGKKAKKAEQSDATGAKKKNGAKGKRYDQNSRKGDAQIDVDSNLASKAAIGHKPEGDLFDIVGKDHDEALNKKYGSGSELGKDLHKAVKANKLTQREAMGYITFAWSMNVNNTHLSKFYSDAGNELRELHTGVPRKPGEGILNKNPKNKNRG